MTSILARGWPVPIRSSDLALPNKDLMSTLPHAANSRYQLEGLVTCQLSDPLFLHAAIPTQWARNN